MPKITWHNCAEQMPPDDFKYVITRIGKTIGKTVNRYLWDDLRVLGHSKDSPIYWTEFTKEKWEALNK